MAIEERLSERNPTVFVGKYNIGLDVSMEFTTGKNVES